MHLLPNSPTLYNQDTFQKHKYSSFNHDTCMTTDFHPSGYCWKDNDFEWSRYHYDSKLTSYQCISKNELAIVSSIVLKSNNLMCVWKLAICDI